MTLCFGVHIMVHFILYDVEKKMFRHTASEPSSSYKLDCGIILSIIVLLSLISSRYRLLKHIFYLRWANVAPAPFLSLLWLCGWQSRIILIIITFFGIVGQQREKAITGDTFTEKITKLKIPMLAKIILILF